MKYQLRNIIHVIQVGLVTALEVCKCKNFGSTKIHHVTLELELTAAPHKNMYTKHSKAEFEQKVKRNTKKIAEGASARRNSYTQMHQKNP